jgi:hypothetical protein
MEELGPPKEIECATCQRTAVLTQERVTEQTFGGDIVSMSAQNWWYQCPAGHREPLEDADQRLGF